MNDENKEALNNLIKSIQEKMGNANVESNETIENNNEENGNQPAFDISSILNNLNSNKNNYSEENSHSNQKGNSGFDPNILLKFQKIMSAMNNNNPKKDLLLSLKPFLRKSRQDKMNEYITILNIITMLGSFRDKGSE